MHFWKPHDKMNNLICILEYIWILTLPDIPKGAAQDKIVWYSSGNTKTLSNIWSQDFSIFWQNKVVCCRIVVWGKGNLGIDTNRKERSWFSGWAHMVIISISWGRIYCMFPLLMKFNLDLILDPCSYSKGNCIDLMVFLWCQLWQGDTYNIVSDHF